MTEQKQTLNRAGTLLTTLATLALLPAGHALTDAGPGALLLDVSAGIAYDSNIFTNNLEEGDTIATLDTMLRYVQDQGVIALDAGAGINFGEFFDFGEHG